MAVHTFFQQGLAVNAADLRDLNNLIWPGSDGVLNSGGAMKVAAQGTPNMTVACADGWVKHAGYIGHNDASKNVTIATANASNPRIDLVVWRWWDQANGDSQDLGDFYVVQGTPAATPIAPSTTGLVCEKLAQVYVAAATSSIAAAAITDIRTLADSRRLEYHQTGSQNLTTAVDNILNTWTKDVDTIGGMGTSAWVVPAGMGGQYDLSAIASVNNGSATFFNLAIRVNGTARVVIRQPAGSAITSLVIPSVETTLADGDSVTVTLYAQGTGSSTANSFGVFFRAKRVSVTS